MGDIREDREFPVMEHMTVRQIRTYLETNRSIILPMGVIEQHGYHLPLRTDALIAEKVGRRIGKETGILVAPTFHHSFSGGGLPGTINVSPSVMSLVVGDILVSLISQGFRSFYLFLCHGGSENVSALKDGIQMLLRNNPAFVDALVALLPVWKLSPRGWTPAFQEHDWHAGWLETSMVMALEPRLVRMEDMELDEEPYYSEQVEHPDNYQHAEKIVDHPMVIPRMSQRPEIQVGVMGAPQTASAERGNQIVDDIVQQAAETIAGIEAGNDGTYKTVHFDPGPIILRANDDQD